jgi:four helix bundle protein
MAINSYRDLVVWQKAMDLAVEVYRLAKLLPSSEQYRVTDQLLRAAASVAANIAEGHTRGTRKDYAKFVSVARGSTAEVETFLVLATRVGLLPPHETSAATALCDEVSKMLRSLHARLRTQQPNP